MVQYGPVWSCMFPYGPVWSHIVLMVTYGSILDCMVLYGAVWFSLFLYGLYGPIRLSLVPYSPVWPHMALHGPLWPRIITRCHILSRSVPYSPISSYMVLFILRKQLVKILRFNYTNMKCVGHGKFHLKSNVWVIYRWIIMIKMDSKWCACPVPGPKVLECFASKSMYFQ